MGDVFQDLQWVPETADDTQPYIYDVFPYIQELRKHFMASLLTYLNCQHHCFALWGLY